MTGQNAFASYTTKCQAIAQELLLVNNLYDWQINEKGAAFTQTTDSSYDIFTVLVSENEAGDFTGVRPLGPNELTPKASDLVGHGRRNHLFRVQNNRYGIEISAITETPVGKTQSEVLARNAEFGTNARKTVSLFSSSNVGLKCTKVK